MSGLRAGGREAPEGRSGNRIGRPPAGDSAETRRRIIRAACLCFGRSGYDVTTNRDVALEASLTPGALYHYFPSKLQLFAATHREVQRVVFSAFSSAAAEGDTLAEKLLAILEQALQLHTDDPTLAAFAASAPIEVQRHPKLRAELGADAWELGRFFDDLVREHQAELSEHVDVTAGVAVLAATTLGLAQVAALSGSVEVHRAGVEGFERLIAGQFFHVDGR